MTDDANSSDFRDIPASFEELARQVRETPKDYPAIAEKAALLFREAVDAKLLKHKEQLTTITFLGDALGSGGVPALRFWAEDFSMCNHRPQHRDPAECLAILLDELAMLSDPLDKEGWQCVIDDCIKDSKSHPEDLFQHMCWAIGSGKLPKDPDHESFVNWFLKDFLQEGFHRNTGEPMSARDLTEEAKNYTREAGLLPAPPWKNEKFPLTPYSKSKCEHQTRPPYRETREYVGEGQDSREVSSNGNEPTITDAKHQEPFDKSQYLSGREIASKADCDVTTVSRHAQRIDRLGRPDHTDRAGAHYWKKAKAEAWIEWYKNNPKKGGAK